MQRYIKKIGYKQVRNAALLTQNHRLITYSKINSNHFDYISLNNNKISK